jgi:hypothetical protein
MWPVASPKNPKSSTGLEAVIGNSLDILLLVEMVLKGAIPVFLNHAHTVLTGDAFTRTEDGPIMLDAIASTVCFP